MSDKKDYQALYLKYKTKYLDLKNSGGAAIIIASRSKSPTRSSSRSRSISRSPTRSTSPIAQNPAQIAYKTKFAKITDNSPNYKYAETECNKVYANRPDKKCKPEEIIKTYEDLMYTKLQSEYSIYIKNYPEILSRIDKAAIKWADFIKKYMEENRTCKTKFLASLRCENFNNYKSNSSSKNKLIYKYNNKKIDFLKEFNLKPELFVNFLDAVTSPNYEDYIKNPSKLIIQSELPFKPTNNKDNDIINFYIHYSTFKKYKFI